MADQDPHDAPPSAGDLAIVLQGGGARAAYQVGLLRAVARLQPDLKIPILTGVSAGAINAVYLAAHPGSLAPAAEAMTDLWSQLRFDQVFRVDAPSLLRNVAYWGLRLVGGGGRITPPLRGLVDTAPLRGTLERILRAKTEVTGVTRNVEASRLQALAVVSSCYTTGQSVAWVQGRDIQNWERAARRSRKTRIAVDHVMASAALPLLFPAVRLNGDWYGDGGIRLTAPLSPALHLGASRILAISTRHRQSADEADQPIARGYPAPMQIAGQLLNAVFLDEFDRDALNMQRLNMLLKSLPADKHHGLRHVDIVVIRPSRDLGRLAAEYEPRLPRLFRHLARSLGSRRTTSPDLLSLLMFEPGYLQRLLELGEADGEANADRIAALLEAPRPDVEYADHEP